MKCSVSDCERPKKARGMCMVHYMRWRRNGDPEICHRVRNDLHARLEKFIDRSGPNGCWLWTGTITRTGYGRITIEGKNTMAHRAVYERDVGPIPEGLELDHLCRVRACVNPAHLEPVTPQENTLRGLSPASLNARKTHCPHGHEYTPENTYQYPHGRQCRTCSIARAGEFNRRKALR